MSLEPIQHPYSAAEERPATEGSNREEPTAASAWWAELSMGAVCCLAAVAIALSQTSLGPFALVSVVYGTIPTVLYVAAATGLGLSFFRSGARRAPEFGGLR